MKHAPLTPLMTAGEISTVETLLRRVADVNHQRVDVLEWGSGGSTLCFPRFLLSCDVSFRWLSLEYNRDWCNIVDAALDEALRKLVSVRLFDVGNTYRYQPKEPMDDYVDYPGRLNRTWDVIIVDGRKRRRCMIEAARMISAVGCVVLHDAERRHYQCSFDRYRYGGFLTPRLWAGCHGETAAKIVDEVAGECDSSNSRE